MHSTPDLTCTYNRLGQTATVADATGTRTFNYSTTTGQLLVSVVAGASEITARLAWGLRRNGYQSDPGKGVARGRIGNQYDVIKPVEPT